MSQNGYHHSKLVSGLNGPGSYRDANLLQVNIINIIGYDLTSTFPGIYAIISELGEVK